MRGGLTLSGGEPLVQNRFAAKLFRATKELGIHTAIETNGFLGAKLSDEELDLIDLVILDMKAFEPEQHKRVTGIGNEPVLAFAKRLAERKRPMWLRYVLVPGLMDDPDEMRRVASFGASLGVVERAEILPFHQMGRYKWKRLGIDYTLDTTEPPSEAAFDAAVAIFRRRGPARTLRPQAHITGLTADCRSHEAHCVELATPAGTRTRSSAKKRALRP